MSKLRVEQWKTEPPDLFAIRAFVKAMPFMDDNALRAAFRYIAERGSAEANKRHKDREAAAASSPQDDGEAK